LFFSLFEISFLFFIKSTCIEKKSFASCVGAIGQAIGTKYFGSSSLSNIQVCICPHQFDHQSNISISLTQINFNAFFQASTCFSAGTG
jgi:hypothetical protein